jgi:hypothetical protein
LFVGSFDELAGLERGAGADEREECFSKDHSTPADLTAWSSPSSEAAAPANRDR